MDLSTQQSSSRRIQQQSYEQGDNPKSMYEQRLTPDRQQKLGNFQNQIYSQNASNILGKSIASSRGMNSQLGRSEQKQNKNNLNYYDQSQNQSYQKLLNNSRSQQMVGLNTSVSHDADSFILQNDPNSNTYRAMNEGGKNGQSAINLTNSFQISESYGISQNDSKRQQLSQKKQLSIFNSSRKLNTQRQVNNNLPKDIHSEDQIDQTKLISNKQQIRRNINKHIQNGPSMIKTNRDLPSIKNNYTDQYQQQSFQSVRIQQNRSQEDLQQQSYGGKKSNKNFSQIQIQGRYSNTLQQKKVNQQDTGKILIKKSRNYFDQSQSNSQLPQNYDSQQSNPKQLNQSQSQKAVTYMAKHKSDNITFQSAQKRLNPQSPTKMKQYNSYMQGQTGNSPMSRKISIDDQRSNSLERLQSQQLLDLVPNKNVSLRSIHKLNIQTKFANQSQFLQGRKSSIDNDDQESQFMEDDIMERLTTNNVAIEGDLQHQSQNYDMRRVTTLDYLINNLENCLTQMSDKNYFSLIKPLYQNIVVSKLLTNFEVIYQSCYILAKVLVAQEMHRQGLLVYYFMRDIAEDMQNYENLMLAYYHIALCLQEQKEYDKGIIAIKKMLGLAWVCNHQNYERKAYQMLSNQYFYLGILKKSKFYTDRASRGKIEGPQSVSRKVAKEVFVRREKVIRSNNLADDAYEQDIVLTRKGNQKIIDITLPEELYERIDEKILQFEEQENIMNIQIQRQYRKSLKQLQPSSDSNRASLKENQLLNQQKKQVEFTCLKELWLPQVKERVMGNKMIRQSTPIERININDVPSPSEQKHDQMLLPNLSQTKANELDMQIQQRGENPYSNQSHHNQANKNSHKKQPSDQESIFTKFDDKSVEFAQKYGYQTCVPKHVRDYLNFPEDYQKIAAANNKDKLHNPFNKPLRPEVIKAIMDSQSGRTATKDKLAEQSNKNVIINQILNKARGLDYLTKQREARVNHKVEMQKKMTMKDIIEQSKINASSQNKQYAFLSHISDTTLDDNGKIKQKKNFTASDQERRDIIELMEILRDRITLMKDYSYITKKFRWDKFNSNKTIEIFYGNQKGERFPNTYSSQPQI